MPPATRKLFVLDVGHGNSALLFDDAGSVLIDAGPGSSLLEFLKQEGVDTINVVLISHADRDHIKGLISLVSSEEVRFGKIRVNSDATKGKLWSDLLYCLDKSQSKGSIDFNVALTVRDTGELDQGSVHIEILAPGLFLAGKGPGDVDRENRKLTSNSLSAVIRLVKEGKPIAVFTGDIDDVGLDNLIESGQHCNASVLIFPHHGGQPGTEDPATFATRICDIFEPETVLFSIGRGSYDTPKPEIVSAVRSCVDGVRIACTQLSEHCARELPTSMPSHLNAQFAIGKERLKCCAGTISIDLDSGLVSPDSGEHNEFIIASAPTAICKSRPSAEVKLVQIESQ